MCSQCIFRFVYKRRKQQNKKKILTKSKKKKILCIYLLEEGTAFPSSLPLMVTKNYQLSPQISPLRKIHRLIEKRHSVYDNLIYLSTFKTY